MKNNYFLTLQTMMLISLVVIVVPSLDISIDAKQNKISLGLKFVGIQNAKSGIISEINSSSYNLELNEITDNTILFSDRPDRIVKLVPTLDFVGNWSMVQDSFMKDAPNAVLIMDEINVQQQDIIIIELFNPVYDSNKKSLNYVIKADNNTLMELPKKTGQTTMIIDYTCESVDSLACQHGTF